MQIAELCLRKWDLWSVTRTGRKFPFFWMWVSKGRCLIPFSFSSHHIHSYFLNLEGIEIRFGIGDWTQGDDKHVTMNNLSTNCVDTHLRYKERSPSLCERYKLLQGRAIFWVRCPIFNYKTITHFHMYYYFRDITLLTFKQESHSSERSHGDWV